MKYDLNFFICKRKRGQTMKRTKGEGGQRSTLFSRFPKKEVSGVGVHLRWPEFWIHVTSFLSRISSCTRNRMKGKPQWKTRVPSLQGFQNIGVSGVGVLLGWGFATETGRKGHRKHSKHLGRPSLHTIHYLNFSYLNGKGDRE